MLRLWPCSLPWPRTKLIMTLIEECFPITKKHEQHAEELVILWPYSLYKFILFDAAHKILKGLEHVKRNALHADLLDIFQSSDHKD